MSPSVIPLDNLFSDEAGPSRSPRTPSRSAFGTTLPPAEAGEQLEQVVRALRKAKRVVVVCGAGVSTAARIPDFRSAAGLYGEGSDIVPSPRGTRIKGPSVKDLFHVGALTNDRLRPAQNALLSELHECAARALPTPFHEYLAALEGEGRLLRCFTQNIDGLEAKVGLRVGIPPQVRRSTKRRKVAHVVDEDVAGASRSTAGMPVSGERERDDDVFSAFAPTPQPKSPTPTHGLADRLPTDFLTPPPSQDSLDVSTPTDTPVTLSMTPFRVIPLHGQLDSLRCTRCAYTSSFASQIPLPPDLLPCPRCAEEASLREALGERVRHMGYLRPSIVLYGEDHPLEHHIGAAVLSDLRGLSRKQAPFGLMTPATPAIATPSSGDVETPTKRGGKVEDFASSIGADGSPPPSCDSPTMWSTPTPTPARRPRTPTTTTRKTEGKADMLLVAGTSLSIPGVKRIIKEFAKSIAASVSSSARAGPRVVFVNDEPPARSAEWEDVFDVWVKGDVQRFIRECVSDSAFASTPRKVNAKARDKVKGVGTPPKTPVRARKLQMALPRAGGLGDGVHLDDGAMPRLTLRASPLGSEAGREGSHCVHEVDCADSSCFGAAHDAPRARWCGDGSPAPAPNVARKGAKCAGVGIAAGPGKGAVKRKRPVKSAADDVFDAVAELETTEGKGRRETGWASDSSLTSLSDDEDVKRSEEGVATELGVKAASKGDASSTTSSAEEARIRPAAKPKRKAKAELDPAAVSKPKAKPRRRTDAPTRLPSDVVAGRYGASVVSSSTGTGSAGVRYWTQRGFPQVVRGPGVTSATLDAVKGGDKGH